MQQIADWLKKLGMVEYAERFVENRIDLSVLPRLRAEIDEDANEPLDRVLDEAAGRVEALEVTLVE